MKFIKRYELLFESKYKKVNIDKKYYLWRIKNYFENKSYKLAVIMLNPNFLKEHPLYILYRIIINSSKGMDSFKDFFTGKKDYDEYYGNIVSLSFWKRYMSEGLLYSTDNREDALLAYHLYLKYPNLTSEELELYMNAEKNNL